MLKVNNYKILLLLMTICLTLVFSGCKRNVSVEHRDFVDTIGIDITDTGNIKVTLLIPDPGKVSKGEKEVNQIVTSEATTFTQALKNADKQSAKKLSLENVRIIVAGEELAKDKEKQAIIFDGIKRNSVISKRVIIAVSKGKASDLLNTKIEGVQIFGKYIVEYYAQSPDDIYTAYDKKLGKLISKMNVVQNVIVPEISVKDGKLLLENGVLFKEGKAINTFNSEILRGYALVNGKINNIVVDVELDGEVIPITIKSSKNKVSFTEKNGSVVVNVKQQYDCSLTEFNGGVSDQNIKKLERLFNEEIKNNIEESYNFFINENNSDVYGFEDSLKKENFDLYSKYTNDATNVEFIRGLELNVVVNSKIISTGSIR